jgi:hypothetical protein
MQVLEVNFQPSLVRYISGTIAQTKRRIFGVSLVVVLMETIMLVAFVVIR